MKAKAFFSVLLLGILIQHHALGQKYMSSSSEVGFFSSAPIENIEATNHASKSVIDMETGKFAFSVPIKKFEFDKALMQEHFNENYLESEKYPNATFVGKIEKWNKESDVQTAIGEMKMHGVTQQMSIDGELRYVNDSFVIESEFFIVLEDFNIKIPQALFYNIAEKIKVTVRFHYDAQ